MCSELTADRPCLTNLGFSYARKSYAILLHPYVIIKGRVIMGRTKLLLNPQLKYEKRESGILCSNH